MSGPYGDAANALVTAGWRGVLPLPVRSKSPPPTGYTGAGGTWPSGADVWTWSEQHPEANIGLRLPPGVIGLDIDAYDAKTGAETLRTHEEQYGRLPVTWAVTSRTDGISGIRLYRVPPGLAWPGDLGGGLEIIQTKHRYVVAPPSVHPEGRTYAWKPPTAPAGQTSGDVRAPSPDALTLLPDAWVIGLTGGRLAIDIAKAEPAGPDVATWYTSAPNNDAPCGIVRTTAGRAIAELSTPGGSRHDTGMRAVMRLCYLSAEGHRGVIGEIELVRTAWHTAVTTGSAGRDDTSATDEWRRIMTGALAVLAADGALGRNDLTDPCRNPFDGILIPDEIEIPAQYQPTYDVAADVWRTPEGKPIGPETPGRDHAGEQLAATARLVEIEAAKLKIRREAKALVDREESLKNWAAPPSLGTLADELEIVDEPANYRVDQVIPEGGNVLLVASFKAGKTTLVNDLVRCLVDNQPFLGRYDVEQVKDGTVALWNYEVGAGQYRRWLRDLRIVRTHHVAVLNLRGYTMPIRSPYVRAWAINWLRTRKVKVWVVDPFARAFLGNGQSENDNTEVGLFLETLDQIKEEAGIAELILPTHTGRATMDVGTERSRGATRLDDWADARWILTKDNDGNRFFRAAGRDVETPEGRLEYRSENRSLTLTDDTREETGTEEKRVGRPPLATGQTVDAAIVTAIGMHPGIGIRGLRDLARSIAGGASHARVADAVERLMLTGEIRVRPGGPGLPTAHYLGVESDRA